MNKPYAIFFALRVDISSLLQMPVCSQIAVKVDLLHGEVLDVLRGVERKIAAHVDEPLKASLGNLLTELKDLLKNERHKYDVSGHQRPIDSSMSSSSVSFERGREWGLCI